MGVQKAKKFVRQQLGEAPAQSLPHGTKVLIDGSGWFHQVARSLGRTDLGGDYAALDEAVTRAVSQLRLQRYDVIVYRDGSVRQLKADTQHERLAQRREEWSNLTHWCRTDEEDALLVAPTAQFPMPPLASRQFYASLARLRVAVHECAGEADQDLARASAEDDRAVVLGDDSDFMFFRGARYVSFEHWKRLAAGKPVPVWTREALAHGLGLAEDLVVEFAILLGNDYTSHFPSEAFGSLEGLSDRHNPHHLLTYLQTQPEGWCVEPVLEKAKLAVDFSRAMYELDPITEFPEDPVLSSVEDGSPRVLQPPDFEVCSGGAEVVARRVVACCVAVPNMLEPLHVDALEAMIATLSGNGGGGVDDGKGRLEAVPPPFWVDVVAAHSYQSVLKRVLAVSSTAVAEFGGIEPRHVFDGFLFHTVLNAARTVSGPLPRPDISCLDNKSVDSDAATDDGDDLAQGALPIDAHRETILAHIAAHRVTVIVGETGCGKSSRLPVMLLQSGGSAKRPVKMFCSQPRRIAAKALCNRVRTTPGFAGLVGMRMGHGEKDESRGTRIWFVTTGYLVRLIAHHPEVLQDHTHLIIDEVHERSVDTDILCLLVRRLVSTHPTIRIVLMSATLCADLYREYFDIDEGHIFVGARRFPITECFADDIARTLRLGPKLTDVATKVVSLTSAGRQPSSNLAKLQYDLAVAISLAVGQIGSSVLIFVPGMFDILELTERFETVNKQRGQTAVYETVPVHSDVPFDDQMRALEPAQGKNAIKIVIATNAAESSLTIPDCDHVICMGQAKSIEYNPTTHRTILLPAWIAKSSAIQRAGRTGRTRPGQDGTTAAVRPCQVYRLYSRVLFETFMRPHDLAEMHKQPLDAVMLSLRAMMADEESVAEILSEALEPPEEVFVERAFHSLYDHGFITAPGDMGELTSMGDFVSQLGLDLQLGRLVGLGAQLDVLPEAIALAGSLSLPKMPWRITTPLIHDDPAEFNKIASTTLYARAHWDAGICSEPLALLRVLRAYEQMRAPMAKHTFCMKHSLADVRMRQFSAQCQHLRERVARALSIDPPPPYDDPIDDPVRLNRLRLVLAWTSRDSVIKLKPSSIKGAPSAGASVRAVVTGPLLSPQQVASIFPPEVAYSFVPGVRHHYTARVDLEIDIEPDALNSRVCSIAFGKGGIGVEAAWTIAPGEKENQFVTLFLTEHGAEAAEELVNLLMAIGEVTESMRATPYGGPGDNMPGKAGGGVIRIIRAPLSKSRERDLKKLLDQCTALGARYSARDLFCVTSVSDGFRLSDTQLRWLFGTPVRDSSENLFKEQALRDKQAVIFPPDAENPKIQPLFSDLPLGARILTTLANANYKTKKMKLWVDDEDKERGMLELKVDVVTPAYERQGGGMIYLPDNSLVKCSVPCGVSGPLFGVAATTLDLQGGAMRAEGVTLLPVGDAWLAKAHLSFGLPSDVKLPRHEADLCRTICEASDAVGEAMLFQPAITRLIDELFGFDVSPAPRDFKLKARQRPIFSSGRGSVSDASRRSKGDGSETMVGKENKKQAAKAKKQMEEWEAVVDKESGDTYFWNKRTGETTWETPAGLDVGKKPPPEPTTLALDDSAELEQFVESLPITAVQKVWMRKMMRREEIGGVEMLQLMDEQAWAQVGAKLELSSKVQRALGQWQTGETKMARQTKTPEQVEEWEAIVEKESGDTYFWNTRTGETTWEKPASTTTAKKTKPNAKAKARAKKVKAKGFHHDGRS